jgi:hypothetical protein
VAVQGAAWSNIVHIFANTTTYGLLATGLGLLCIFWGIYTWRSKRFPLRYGVELEGSAAKGAAVFTIGFGVVNLLFAVWFFVG